jgi:hypothetical protein
MDKSIEAAAVAYEEAFGNCGGRDGHVSGLRAAIAAYRDTEIADLRTKLEAAEHDAERYRKWKWWFREGEVGLWNAICEANSDAEHDAAIDAARGGEHG